MIADISFPVYKLRDIRPQEDQGVLYYHDLLKIHQEDKPPTFNETIYIIDDKNIDASSLAKRRLLMLSTSDIKLYPLKSAIFFLADLIKIATSKTWFIDSKGKLFTYKKTKTVQLKCFKILKTIHIPTGGALLEVEGIPSRFKCLRTPEPDEQYAGLLHISQCSYILYGLYNTPFKTSRRKI